MVDAIVNNLAACIKNLINELEFNNWNLLGNLIVRFAEEVI